MKRLNINKIKTICLALAVSCLATTGCTGDFEQFNTDSNSAQKLDLTMLITTMEMDAVFPCGGSDTDPVNRYQTGFNLLGDNYAGYMAGVNNWGGGLCPIVYKFNNTEAAWENTNFEVAFLRVMPAWLSLKYAHENKQISDDIYAVANILKVMSLHRVTDMYGPAPVTHFGEAKNPYESAETCYAHYFEVLNDAIAVLEDFVAGSPNAKPLEKVDAVYGGDYSKWLKLANSIKLRLAMRIVYVEPGLAKQYAKEAVESGVMEDADDSALLKSYRNITVNNPLKTIWDGYADARMSASMDSYLNGYKDPRLKVYFQEAATGGYHGVANGIYPIKWGDYKTMSSPNVVESTPVRWMMASEVAFLRAEGAMRGWKAEMQGDAETFYKKGIELSFVENGLAASAAAEYAENTSARPIDFQDVSDAATKYNIPARSDLSIQWDEGADPELKLERIITQKWIAMYPNGQEAWSEFRRTGYPRIFPVRYNASGDINTENQIRRVVFPQSEYSNNLTAVNKAIALLGGPDSGATKLWWDKK